MARLPLLGIYMCETRTPAALKASTPLCSRQTRGYSDLTRHSPNWKEKTHFIRSVVN